MQSLKAYMTLNVEKTLRKADVTFKLFMSVALSPVFHTWQKQISVEQAGTRPLSCQVDEVKVLQTLPYVRPHFSVSALRRKEISSGFSRSFNFKYFPASVLKAAEAATTAIRKLKTLLGNAKTFTLM